MVVAPTTNDLYGLDVAERKSPPATSSKVLPKPAPELSSTPSQRPEPPVIAVQKEAKVVPEVPKRVRVPPPTERLVVLAVVAKKLVVVADVPVALTKVKFCKVEEPVARRLARVAREEELMTDAKRLVEKKSVEVAAVVVE